MMNMITNQVKLNSRRRHEALANSTGVDTLHNDEYDDESSEGEFGDNLVAQTRRFRSEFVKHAKKAKRVDIIGLKENIWTLTSLTERSQYNETGLPKGDHSFGLPEIMNNLKRFYPREKMKDIFYYYRVKRNIWKTLTSLTERSQYNETGLPKGDHSFGLPEIMNNLKRFYPREKMKDIFYYYRVKRNIWKTLTSLTERSQYNEMGLPKGDPSFGLPEIMNNLKRFYP
ncbi:hypothetical protein RclHR1_05980003 [Rhizophagus clarus]|uniref:Uncharacterized protein n=1 Tax=Rhizophagus clarus TaxID=94130 RepID=A0A2Z6S299_9GLOM|nr:hypothetical protein RclHR1_05980003 [Rhizophagus clarus]